MLQRGKGLQCGDVLETGLRFGAREFAKKERESNRLNTKVMKDSIVYEGMSQTGSHFNKQQMSMIRKCEYTV